MCWEQVAQKEKNVIENNKIVVIQLTKHANLHGKKKRRDLTCMSHKKIDAEKSSMNIINIDLARSFRSTFSYNGEYDFVTKSIFKKENEFLKN